MIRIKTHEVDFWHSVKLDRVRRNLAYSVCHLNSGNDCSGSHRRQQPRGHAMFFNWGWAYWRIMATTEQISWSGMWRGVRHPDCEFLFVSISRLYPHWYSLVFSAHNLPRSHTKLNQRVANKWYANQLRTCLLFQRGVLKYWCCGVLHSGKPQIMLDLSDILTSFRPTQLFGICTPVFRLIVVIVGHEENICTDVSFRCLATSIFLSLWKEIKIK